MSESMSNERVDLLVKVAEEKSGRRRSTTRDAAVATLAPLAGYTLGGPIGAYAGEKTIPSKVHRASEAANRAIDRGILKGKPTSATVNRGTKLLSKTYKAGLRNVSLGNKFGKAIGAGIGVGAGINVMMKKQAEEAKKGSTLAKAVTAGAVVGGGVMAGRYMRGRNLVNGLVGKLSNTSNRSGVKRIMNEISNTQRAYGPTGHHTVKAGLLSGGIASAGTAYGSRA